MVTRNLFIGSDPKITILAISEDDCDPKDLQLIERNIEIKENR